MDAQDFLMNQSVDLITMSYSLTMMESYFGIVDSMEKSLSISGILAIADFFSAPNRSDDPTRYQSLGFRTFWRLWFNLDNVYLDPDRRFYLEHKFKTLFQLNCAHEYIRWIKVPYFVYIGSKKESKRAQDENKLFRLKSIRKRHERGQLDETDSLCSDSDL